MTGAFFQPNGDADADSYETQKDYEQEAWARTAVRLPSSGDEAFREILTKAADRRVLCEMPDNTMVTIRMKRGSPPRSLWKEMPAAPGKRRKQPGRARHPFSVKSSG